MLFSPFGLILTLLARLLGNVVPQYRPPTQLPQIPRSVEINDDPERDRATSA